MKVFKENTYDIVKLYVNQLGIMIFSMMLYTAVGAFEDEKLSLILSIIVSVFSIGFYLVLIYYVMWEIGAKDKIRIDGDRMEPQKHKGLLMGVFANIPNLVLGLLTVITLGIYMLTDGEVLYSVFLVLNMIMRFHGSMYLGVITNIIPVGADGAVNLGKYMFDAVLFVILPAISVFTTHFAYTLGSQDKKFFSLFKAKG